LSTLDYLITHILEKVLFGVVLEQVSELKSELYVWIYDLDKLNIL
jgi:hypothetical protein